MHNLLFNVFIARFGLASLAKRGSFFILITICLQELLSSQQFWKNYYALSHIDCSDEENPTGHLKSWQDPDCFYCYWDENEDKSNIYVFSEPPKRWKCGIIHLSNFTLQSCQDIKYKDFFYAVRILMRIQKAATELELDCGKNVFIAFMFLIYTSDIHFLMFTGKQFCQSMRLFKDVYKTWTKGPWTTLVDPVHGPDGLPLWTTPTFVNSIFVTRRKILR